MTPPIRKRKSSFEIGVNLRVTQCFDKGGRNYMEDFSKYYFEKDPTNNQSVIFAFFGVFDGHGGTEAADLANQNLLEEIKKQEDFWSQNDNDVLQAIRQGFLKTHAKMVEEREKWPLTPSGFQSTAGTTASIAIIRNRKLYVGHVGDSAVVIGYCGAETKDAITDNWSGTALTVEHKPDHPEERRRIEAHGGSVRRKAGIHRVVWNRPKTAKGMTATASTTPVQMAAEYEEIPFLAVARSLGDLWSFDPETREFHVSPEPDISVYELRPNEHRCLIIGSDGLWNVIKPETAVELVRLCERETESRVFADATVSPSFFYHPAGTLVQFALERCQQRNVRADNVTALVVMIDPPGKPMTQLRHERRRLLFGRLGLEERSPGIGQGSPPLAPDTGNVRRFLVESQRAVGRDACSSPTAVGAVPAPPDIPASPELSTVPIVKATKGKGLPALCVLRNILQGSTGFPTLVEAWTEACWREMLAYCRETGLTGSGTNTQLDPKSVMDHLMDMDAKYRKEALQAVPTVLSMKRAFARDHEMTVCLTQIPLLSREWTQLLVMTSSNPSSPTSPSAHPTTSPLASPTGPPSPSACRRWLDRREKILSHLYQMLGRKLPNELSKDAQECMKAHVAREVSQRMRISRPGDLDQEQHHQQQEQVPEEEDVEVKPESTGARTRRQRRLTANGINAEASPTTKKPVLRRVIRAQAKHVEPEPETHLSLPIVSSSPPNKELKSSPERSLPRTRGGQEAIVPSICPSDRGDTQMVSSLEPETSFSRTRKCHESNTSSVAIERLSSRSRRGVDQSPIPIAPVSERSSSRIRGKLEPLLTPTRSVPQPSPSPLLMSKAIPTPVNARSISSQSAVTEPSPSTTPLVSEDVVRSTGIEKANHIESSGATSQSLTQLSILAANPTQVQTNGNPGPSESPTVMPWRRANRRNSRMSKEDQDPEVMARVNHLMEKLVVVVQPAPEELLKTCPSHRPKSTQAESGPPKPRPILLPSTKRSGLLKRKRKSESDADKSRPSPKTPPPKLSLPENFGTYRNYKAFFKKVIVDATAEARLEEVMRSVTYRQVDPFANSGLAARPVLTSPPTTTTVDSEPLPTSPPPAKEPKRRRLEIDVSEAPPVTSGRRSLRLRSNKSE